MANVATAVRSILFGSGASVACLTMFATGQARAQEQAGAPGSEVQQEVVVTGTRIKRDGYTAPTPTTVLSSEQMATTSPGNVADALNQLPQFLGSSKPEAGGVSANGAVGANLLSLRNLGSQRTLVLLDGQRFVASTDTGAVDIDSLPQNLIRSADVVTGGASAAYGSDAVAGVVNFVLDKKFTGWKADIQGGTSTYGDATSALASIARGFGFADGRGHVLLSGEYSKSDGIGPDSEHRDWNNREASRITIPGPPGTLLLKDNVTVSAATYGGLITSGPLAGTQFGPGGVPEPFTFGIDRSSTFMVGGDGIRNNRNLSAGLERYDGFGRVEYEFNEHATASVEGTYVHTDNSWQQYANYCYTSCAATIFSGNAFLPAATQAAMTAGGINSFQINRIFSENNILAESRKNLYRGALGLTGTIAGDWTYDSYVTFGRSDNYIANPNTLDYNHYYAAVDAVVDPASGNVVCRSTLSGLSPGCVPINLFGAGSPSAASLSYIEQTEWRDLILEQTVASASVQGKLFSIDDRPLQLAAGAEWRHETSNQTVSANSSEVVDFTGIRGGAASVNGQKGPFIVGNPQPLSGGYSVKEAFAELAVPLLHDLTGAKLLDSDFAARYTDYSLSGGVTTWKASANWKPFQDLRFRATRSRDIRAPNTAELFTGASQGIGTARNPQTGQTVDVITITSGNPKLDPEIADTLTYGVVYQPSFLDGLSISIDHYSIKIKGAIATLARQQVFDQCYGGNPSACSYIQLDGTQYRLALPYLNINELEVAGDDIEASYIHQVGPGRLSARMLANYQPTYQTTTPGGVVDDIAGETGLTDNPRWRGSFSVNYDLGPVSAFVQERYIDHGIYDHTLVAGKTVNENSVHQVFYTDLTAKYRFGSEGHVEAFLTVNNLFNRAPPFAPNVSGTHAFWSNFDLYDTIGRYFTLGARVNF